MHNAITIMTVTTKIFFLLVLLFLFNFSFARFTGPRKGDALQEDFTHWDFRDANEQEGYEPPIEWREKIHRVEMLYASPEPSVCLMPEVGNGYLATPVSSSLMYIANFFNGIYRVKLPSPIGITLENATLIASALNMLEGVFYRRWQLENSEIIIEQRFYAHRHYKNLLIHELEWIKGESFYPFEVVNVQNLFNPNNMSHGQYGLDCNPQDAGSTYLAEVVEMNDERYSFHFKARKPAMPNTNSTEAIMITSPIVQQVLLAKGKVSRHITAVMTSIETPPHHLYAETLKVFQQASDQDDLFTIHTKSWNLLWKTGVTVDISTHEGKDAARHFNSSMYFLLSSIREDWIAGISPGGIASNSYNGGVFIDMDFWMYPGLLMLHPTLARAILEYRIQGHPAAQQFAKLHNYFGTMYPWVAGFNGTNVCDPDYGAGICSLEQHVTGAVAIAMYQYWLCTKDVNYLREVYPILRGIADFWVSRASLGPDGSFIIRGVIPINEWSANSAAVAAFGVINNAETNVVAKRSLEIAINTSRILSQPVNPLWNTVLSTLVIPYDNEKDIFIEFEGFDFEHPICPVDVVMLNYPLMYPMSNTTLYNMMEYYSTEPNNTCDENPGMTEMVHIANWMDLGDVESAQYAFNRSMHAACYGPFNVRNEVDQHGHGWRFNNTHFLTGDGGFVQAILFGYGGIRIMENGLRFNPQLPLNVTGFTFRGLHYLGNVFDVSYNELTVRMTLKTKGADLSIVFNNNLQVPFTDNAITFQRNSNYIPFVLQGNSTVDLLQHMYN